MRASFDAKIRELVDRLQHSPETSARAEALKDEWLSDPAIEELSSWIWETTRRAVTGYATRSEDEEPGPLARGVEAFGTTLLENEELLHEIEAYAIDVVVGAIEQHRHEVADLIAQTVAGWDKEATSRRMELARGARSAVREDQRDAGGGGGSLVGLAIYAYHDSSGETKEARGKEVLWPPWPPHSPCSTLSGGTRVARRAGR